MQGTFYEVIYIPRALCSEGPLLQWLFKKCFAQYVATQCTPNLSTLLWRHNRHDGVSNHQPHECLFNRPGADQRKHESFASLAFVRVIHRRPVNSPHKWSVSRKMFPFDDVIMGSQRWQWVTCCLEETSACIYGFNQNNKLIKLPVGWLLLAWRDNHHDHQ